MIITKDVEEGENDDYNDTWESKLGGMKKQIQMSQYQTFGLLNLLKKV